MVAGSQTLEAFELVDGFVELAFDGLARWGYRLGGAGGGLLVCGLQSSIFAYLDQWVRWGKQRVIPGLMKHPAMTAVYPPEGRSRRAIGRRAWLGGRRLPRSR